MSEASWLRRDVFWASKASPLHRCRQRFLDLTVRKTSRCNLAIEISFVPSSQSTFNFSVLRGTQVDFLLFNLLRPGPGATRLAGEPDLFVKNYSFKNTSEGIWEDKMLKFGAPT